MDRLTVPGSSTASRRRERVLAILGWVGMCCVVFAFAAKSQGWIDRGTAYFVLNAAGSVLLCASNIARRNFQSLSLNGVWAAIAIVSLVEGWLGA